MVLVQLPRISVVWAEGDKPYLSQEFIDTKVQNAYYGFISAAEFGSEQKQREAIAKAKKVANHLKQIAQGDPNRRYVLWRVSELEHQIYLEEEELFLKKLYRTQKEINVLCNKFNTEVGKSRPSFVNLVAIHSQMLDVSPRKADELAWLIEDRDKNISREVSYSLEKALLAQHYDKAKKEFSYIRKNRKYLFISDQKYYSFEKRIRVKLEADDMVENIDKYLGDVNASIKKNKVSDARRTLEFLHDRIKAVHTHIPYGKYSSFIKRIRRLSDEVTRIEDSLVVENLELVHARRTDAAIDYMEKVLRRSGVSNEKIGMVNRAIMELPDSRRKITAVDQSVDRELSAFANTQDQKNGFSFGAVEAKMKAKMDSVRAYQQEQAQLAQIEYEKAHHKEIRQREKEEKLRAKYQKKIQKITLKIYTYLEQNQIDKAKSLFEKKHTMLEKYASADVYAGLQTTMVQAEETLKTAAKKDEKNYKKARKVTEEIYVLLKQEEVEQAYSKFTNLQMPLQKYSSEVAFTKLKQDVQSAYTSFQKAKQQEQQEQQMQASAATSESSSYARGDPYSNYDRKQAEAEDNAIQNVMEIYTLLEQNQVAVAYEFFKKNQEPIKNHVCQEAYDVLESTVVEAYKSQMELQ